MLRTTQIKKADFYILFHCEPECKCVPFIPFMLLSLVENMLKHGDLSDPVQPGSIKVFKSDGINDTGLHIGLTNIRQRLFNIYGNKGIIHYSTADEALQVRGVSLPFETMQIEALISPAFVNAHIKIPPVSHYIQYTD